MRVGLLIQNSLLQTMLMMSGKLRGPFEIYYVEFTDAYGNGFSLPWCTAITLITSLLRLRPFGFILVFWGTGPQHDGCQFANTSTNENIACWQAALCCKMLKESSYLLKPFDMEDPYP